MWRANFILFWLAFSLERRHFAATIALAALWFACCSSAHATTRKIYDCGDPFNDTTCYLNRFSSAYNYTFGRSEGQIPRGPNPLNGTIYYGSTDVDDLYDVMGSVQNYYMSKFGRNGPNSMGGTGNGTASFPYDTYFVLANANGSADGASLCGGSGIDGGAWSGTTFIAACRGSTNVDVVGHEEGHILMSYLRQNPDSSWVYLNVGGGGTLHETGAINEGMADFFGEALERYATGTTDWQFIDGSRLVRSMSDPPSVAHTPTYPDRYLSPDFYTGTDAHINAGIIGKASYLAVEGGIFNGFTITGIGFDKVEQIWYRGLTQYFNTSESFNQAYTDLLHAANDLYGPDDVWQVTMALRAVEMNMPLSFNGDFNGDGIVDAADYVTWRKGLGTDYSLGSLDRWRANFGNPPGSGAQLSAVPEPAALLLLIVACLTPLLHRHRKPASHNRV